MKMKLLDTYKSILAFAGCHTTPEGQIYAKMDSSGDTLELKANGKKWVLPTEDNCKKAYADDLSLFHPLNENVIKPESIDIKRLTKCLITRINFSTYTLFATLLHVASDTSTHLKLTPEQSEMCSVLKQVSTEQSTNIDNLMLLAINRKDDLYKLVHVHLKRGTTIKGARHSRTGNITFPFYEHLKDGEVCNRKVKKQEKEIIIRLYEYVFPNCGVEDEYSHGSDANTAPYLEALLRACLKVVDRITYISSIFDPFIEDKYIFDYDNAWLLPFEDLKGYESEIRTVAATQSTSDVENSTTGSPVSTVTRTANGVSAGSLIQSLSQRPMVPMQNPYAGILQQQPIGMPQPGRVAMPNVPTWAIGKPQPMAPAMQPMTYPYPQQMYQQPMYPQQVPAGYNAVQQPLPYPYPQQAQVYNGYPQQPVYQQQMPAGYNTVQQPMPYPQQPMANNNMTLANTRVSR